MQADIGDKLPGFIFVALVLIAVGATLLANRKRKGGLRDLAGQYGWQLLPVPDQRIQDRYDGRPFDRSGDVRDLVIGEHRGHSFQAFEFSYWTSNRDSSGTGRTSTTSYFIHVSVPLPGPAPRVEISRRRVGSAIAEAFSDKTFRLGDPAFDRAFTVRAADEVFTRELLQSGLAGWLTAQASPRPLIVDGDALRTWKSGRLRAKELPPLLDYLCGAMEQVPAQVWPVRPG